MIENIKEILLELGYTNILDNGKEFRTRPIYRDSNNNTVLKIKKDTGQFVDFARSISGSFEDLVKITLGLKDIGEAKQWLSGKTTVTATIKHEKPEVKESKIFPNDSLLKLSPIHDYWISRGVSIETIKLFKGGVANSGRMANRYVFPIFNHKNEIVGFSGRDILKNSGDSRPKWKHYGDKSQWKYPLILNHQEIKESKSVILVESIGDMLSLWDNGVKNVIVTFGLDISISIVNFLLKFNVEQIIIAFNNDSANNSAGNEAANKAEKKLIKYFDYNQIKVRLPIKKDFGEMTKEEIKKWKTSL